MNTSDSNPKSSAEPRPLECALDSRPAGMESAPVHDCWSVIGVNGNATCRELEKFIHCRNCPVYSAAALQLLDRPLPLDYRRERTLHYAEAKKLTQPARISVMIFRVANEWLALPTTAFHEVAERRRLHSLPHRSRAGGAVLGLVNIRGELLICVSLARALGLDHRTADAGAKAVESSGRLLVAQWNGQRLVFPVDEVQGLHRLQRDELREPPATVSQSALTHTQGLFSWRDRSVGCLNADSLFSDLHRNLA